MRLVDLPAESPSRSNLGRRCNSSGSWRRRCRQSDRADPVFQGGVADCDDQLIRGGAISLYYYRAVFTFGGIKQGSQLFEADLLIPEIDGRHPSAGDADNLLIELRAKGKARKGQR